MDRRLAVIAACCIPASLAMAGLVAPQPLFLINTSPSEPTGLYVRDFGDPAPGRLVAFRPPTAGRAYADAYLPEIGRGGILKTFVGQAGDRACAEDGVLRLNGKALGRIQATDGAGRPLPRWSGCLVLGAGQHLAFSDRIPNSYDSRYYGPVSREDVIGVFEPLWVRP